MEQEVISYMVFDKNLCCGRLQFEVGKTYEGELPILGEKGFHAYESPFDSLIYSSNINENRFCKVKQSGEILTCDTLRSSSKIEILEEIGFKELIKEGIDWMKRKLNPNRLSAKPDCISVNNDYISDGYKELFVATVNHKHIVSKGEHTTIGLIGQNSKVVSIGACTLIGSVGFNAQISLNGYWAKLLSSGEYAKIYADEYSAEIISTGPEAEIASSGGHSLIVSSGIRTCIHSDGDFSKIISLGVFSNISSCGAYSSITNFGSHSVISCTGNNSSVRSVKDSWITLAEWNYSKDCGFVLVHIKTEYVDGERIKEDVWYKLQDGDFVECSPEG